MPGSISNILTRLVQAGCATTADTIRIAKHAMKAGADGAALLSPFFYGTDMPAMIEHFATVAESVPDFPVYLYNIPGNTRNPITLDIVEAVIKRCPNVAGIKDSSKEVITYLNIILLSKTYGVLQQVRDLNDALSGEEEYDVAVMRAAVREIEGVVEIRGVMARVDEENIIQFVAERNPELFVNVRALAGMMYRMEEMKKPIVSPYLSGHRASRIGMSVMRWYIIWTSCRPFLIF